MKKIAWMLCFGLAASGCSFEKPEPGKFSIILQDQDTRELVAPMLNLGAPEILNLPSSASSFNCFAANVTGEGIVPNSADMAGCESPNNMNGRGFGRMSKLTVRGNAIQMEVPGGKARAIDVYGIYPSAHIPECGGTSTSGGGGGYGYFLGRVIADLLEPKAVVVPIFYNGTDTHSIACTGGHHNDSFQVHLAFPNGGVGGTVVKVHGGGFQSGATVKIGADTCAVTSVLNHEIQCTAGAPTAYGAQTVTVYNPDGTTASKTSGFTYVSTQPFLTIDQDPAKLNFGSVNATSGFVDHTILLMNSGGGGAGTMSATVSGPHFVFKGGAYPGTGGTCGASLAAGANCNVVVQYDPTATGQHTAALSFTAGAPSNNPSVQLTGTGI